MALWKKLLIPLTGNRHAQHFLERNVKVCQFLMGIGCGSRVGSSGERAVFARVERRGVKPYCIFDVGANAGQYLKLVCDTFALSDFSVHCFEPGRWTFEQLEKNAPRGGDVTLNNVALGKENGELTLYYDARGSGLASLTKRELGHYGIAFDQSETVAVETLDRYCQEKGIGRIDLLKLDVEGHELDVLRGAAELFGKGAVEVVTFEFGGGHVDTRCFFRDFFDFFQEAHMRILRITPSGYLAPIDSYTVMHEQFRTTNFACVKKGRGIDY